MKKWRYIIFAAGVAPAIGLMLVFTMAEMPAIIIPILVGTAIIDALILRFIWHANEARLRAQGWEW